MLVVRFVALETSPPGFYVDEAAGAAHVLCFAKDGANFHGEPWPLWSVSLANGLTSPVFLYLQTGWTCIFGTSPSGFRSLSAFAGVITIVATVFIAFRFAGLEAAIWTLLAGLVSPWGFSMSRIAWDAPFAPMFLMAGIAIAVNCRSRWAAMIAGILLALSMYSYPPFYFQTSLILILLIVFRKHLGLSFRGLAFLFFGFFVAVLPMIPQILNGRLIARTSAIGLWVVHPSNPVGGKQPLALLAQYLKNILSHLHPNFLLIHGDTNLRHSTGFGGVLSWFDAAVILMLIAIIVRYAWRRQWALSKIGFPIGFAAVGWLTALMAASLTWESIPHALRSIGGWPFVILLTGLGAHRFVGLQKRAKPVLVGIALLFTAFYLTDYFFRYPQRSASWFDADIKAKALTGQKPGNYPDLAWTYFQMEYLKK